MPPQEKNHKPTRSFFDELKRRRVVRTAISYLVIAWLIVQVISVVGPAFNLGANFMRIAIIALAIGFPLALLTSWFFSISLSGIERESDDSLPPSNTDARNIDFTIIGILLAALIASLFFRGSNDPIESASNNVLAVLPLSNLSSGEDDASFVDGLHDDLLTTLSRISALEVISRTSVMGFRDTTSSIPSIGKKLGADKIIEGSVQRAGSMIRVNVQLIDSRTDKHLWANIYERPYNAEQVFALQSDIARSVATELKAALSLQEDQSLTRVPTKSTEAYRLYLLGKQRIEDRTNKSLMEAIDYLQQAITLDPTYAEAYAALSIAHSLTYSYAGITFEDMLREAMPAVQRALEFNEFLPEAHTILADLRGMQGDLQGAEESYLRALELNSNSVLTRHWYGSMMVRAGRYEEALAQHQKAQQLDPLSPIIGVNVAQDLNYLGRPEEALAEYQRTLEISPDFVPAYAHMAAMYRFSFAQPDESVRWLRQAVDKDSAHTEYPSQLAESLLDLQMPDIAGEWADRAYVVGPTRYWPLRAKVLHAAYTNNAQDIERFTNEMLDRIPRQHMSLALKSRNLVSLGDTDTARQLFINAAPQLFESPPRVDMSNYAVALLLAYVERESGNTDQAETLAQAALTSMADQSRLGSGGIEVFDAEAHALMGFNDTAIELIEQAVADDWTSNWWQLRINPVFDPLRDNPRFVQVIEDMDARMSALRSDLLASDIDLSVNN